MLQKRAWVTRQVTVIRECPELRTIRDAYAIFTDQFAYFSKQNGTGITGTYLASDFLHFKAAFEPFLFHAEHYFNASVHSQTVRRYSPLLQFSAKLLREWAILISTMNQLSEVAVLPHLYQLQAEFEGLSSNVSTICGANLHRLYHRDTLFVASNATKRQITSVYQQVYNVLSREATSGFSDHQLAALKRDMLMLSRDLHDNFLKLLPSAITTTPEMTRTKAKMKVACGNIIAMLDAAFFYRRRVRSLLNRIATLHNAICGILDRLGIRYEIEVAPINTPDADDGDEAAAPTAEERVESFVNDVSEMLHISTTHVSSPVEKLNIVEKALRKVLGAAGRRPPQLEVLSPVANRRTLSPSPMPAGRTRSRSSTGRLTSSLWQERRKHVSMSAQVPLPPRSPSHPTTPMVSPRDSGRLPVALVDEAEPVTTMPLSQSQEDF
jgi:hypothetical protein